MSYAINNVIGDTSRAGFGLEDVEDTTITNVVSPDGFGMTETVYVAQYILHTAGIAGPAAFKKVDLLVRPPYRRGNSTHNPSCIG